MESQSSKIENPAQKHRLLASRDQNTTFAAHYRLAWLRANRWNFVIALFILSLIPGFYAIGFLFRQTALDVSRTPAIQGRAYVVSKTIRPGHKTNNGYDITFRLNGRMTTIYPNDIPKWEQTPLDTFVPVTYHIGANGLVLISDWQTAPVK